MFCVKCGKELEDGYTFCPNCGAAQQNNVTPLPNTAHKEIESITINKRFLKKGILIAVIAVVLISVCVTIFSENSNSNTLSTTKTADVVGKWQEKDTPSVYLTLEKDNTGEMSSGSWAIKLNWTYSKTSNVVTLEISGMGSSTATYNPQNDTISRDGVVFVRVS